MQKHVNLVDLVKSFPTNIFLQNLASIQKRTSPVKFAHLAEKSEKGSIANNSTKVRTWQLCQSVQYSPSNPMKRLHIRPFGHASRIGSTTPPFTWRSHSGTRHFLSRFQRIRGSHRTTALRDRVPTGSRTPRNRRIIAEDVLRGRNQRNVRLEPWLFCRAAYLPMYISFPLRFSNSRSVFVL